MPVSFGPRSISNHIDFHGLRRGFGRYPKRSCLAQEVNAALADPMVAQALNVEINSATLKIDRLVHNRDGAAVHHVTVWTTPLRTRLVMEVDADDIDGYNVGRLLHDVLQSKTTRGR